MKISQKVLGGYFLTHTVVDACPLTKFEGRLQSLSVRHIWRSRNEMKWQLSDVVKQYYIDIYGADGAQKHFGILTAIFTHSAVS